MPAETAIRRHGLANAFTRRYALTLRVTEVEQVSLGATMSRAWSCALPRRVRDRFTQAESLLPETEGQLHRFLLLGFRDKFPTLGPVSERR